MDSCRTCKGRKTVAVDTGRRGGRPRVPCPDCGGTGKHRVSLTLQQAELLRVLFAVDSLLHLRNVSRPLELALEKACEIAANELEELGIYTEDFSDTGS